MRRDSSVGITTGYGLDGLRIRVRVPVRVRFFSLHIVQRDSGTNPSSEGFFPNVRRPGSEADHSYTNSAEVKNISTPLYVFMAQYLIS
jgi:hypothetical protein